MATSASYQRPRFLAPGDKLGKYDLIRQIAIGGMAELYLARTVGIEGFEKLVVVKRILPQFMANQQFVGMFLNEARLAATLHHPNIAQVYDIGVEEGDYFFSMEYIHGEDLGRLNATAIENGVPLSLDAALTLAAGLCAGLHYAHEKSDGEGKPLNVVHRDVSPSNVLVSYDGGVKLVDFGIARASSHQTTQGGLKGKIVYMSPEQCKGNIKLDRRSDIFSVGALLFELTTGRTPFNSETEYGILNQIVNEDVPAPRTIVPGYPPALEKIVLKALERDPEKRFPTALALQGALEDFAHENRLRVSPLVLARVMSSLFPARLEEWEHARKQGAFFVEQHVLQTLIEDKRSDSETALSPPFAPDNDATGVDTQITTLPGGTQSGLGDDVTNVLGIVAVMPPTPEESVPVPQPIGVAPSEPPPLPTAPLPPPMRLPTPLPGLNLHPRMPTPVPNMPGAVPIIGAFGGAAPNAPAMPMPTPFVEGPTLAVPPIEGDAPARSGRSRVFVIAFAAIAVVAVGAFLISRKTTPEPPAAAAEKVKAGGADDEIELDDTDAPAATDGNKAATPSSTESKPATGAKAGDDVDGTTKSATAGAGPGSTGLANGPNTATGKTGKTTSPANGTTSAIGTTGKTTTAGNAAAGTSAGAGTTGKTTTAGATGKTTAASTGTTGKSDATAKTTKPTTKPTTKSTTTKSTTKTDNKGSAWSADSPFLPVPTTKR